MKKPFTRNTRPRAGLSVPLKVTGGRIAPRHTGTAGHIGLGLAIAKTIVSNHSGTITAANNIDAGACFTVVLPAAAPTARASASPPS